MSNERPVPFHRPDTEFGLTEHEQLFDRVSHNRLLEFLDDETTTVHRVEESTNSYGEFLFVTVSKPGSAHKLCVTFYGLGFHEHRERWLIDEWSWYHANALPDTLKQYVPKDDAKALVQERLEQIRPYATQQTQSARGKLFEMLADLTDENGALAELEDLDDLADWLTDDLE